MPSPEPTRRRAWLRGLCCAAALALAGCSEPAPSSRALPPEAVARLLAGGGASAPALTGAQGLQESVGVDGGLGPTDYRYFGRAQAAPGAWQAWLAEAQALDTAPPYERPLGAAPWWPDEATFKTLRFVRPPQPAPGVSGWLALDPLTGTLWLVLSTS